MADNRKISRKKRVDDTAVPWLSFYPSSLLSTVFHPIVHSLKGIPMKAISKKEAISIIICAAKDYEKLLNNKNFVFIYKNRTLNRIEYFEALFNARNFQHLAGIRFTDTSGHIITNRIQFYHKCIHNRLSESEIHFKSDGTTALKLYALPQIIHFLNSSRMTALYNSCRPRLSIDRLIGTTNYSLGFTYDSRGYYVPSSSLLEDIRNLSSDPFQILAILSKPASGTAPLYKEIKYMAKNICPDRLFLPHTLKSILDIPSISTLSEHLVSQ
ncbi:PBECR4 domain-containing protein [Acetatifactor muris]|nr:PBECR4 domain-containing protein [Acetatifactor muris]MCR2048970.1 PBECR4 domain-containing protein [Acetatifactor muris]